MKKKFFSKLLMGALLVATVSSYVSCKDYDDDIANLQSQIAAQEQAHALKTELESAKSEAAANLAAAEARLQALIDGKASAADLSAAKSELEAAIAGVKTTAEKAGTDVATALSNAADAQSAADKAQSAADAAMAAAQAADKKIDEKVAEATTAIQTALDGKADKAATDAAIASVNAELTKLAEAQKSLATADDLTKAVAELEKKIQAVTDAADLTPYVARLNALESGVATLWSAVTSVSLYVTNGYNSGEYLYHRLQYITFANTTELETINFPLDADKAQTGGNQFDFEKDRKAVYDNNHVIVRVSPSTAVLKAENIEVINSQGKKVDTNLIENITVERYTKLLTRADADEEVNNGLWKVSFKLKKGYKEADLYEMAKTDGDVENGKDILYAIAVNNTKNEAADRRVVSEYDLYLRITDIYPTNSFNVNDQTVERIHNRYEKCEDNTSTAGVPELVWKRDNKGNILYKTGSYTADDVTSRNKDYSKAWNDNRQEWDIKHVELGEDIEIEFTTPIRGFYVMLDYDFALESKPSEVRAWNSYNYEGVGKIDDETGEVTQAATLFVGQTGTIKINSTGGRGDVIGFRVFAVNLDGTLCDPDGRAFYVSVGTEVDKKPLSIDVTVYNKAASDSPNGNFEIVPVDAGFFNGDANEWTLTWSEENESDLAVRNDNNINSGAATYLTPEAGKPDYYRYKAGTATYTSRLQDYDIEKLFEISYAKDNNNNTAWKDSPEKVDGGAGAVKFVKVKILDFAIWKLLDNEVYTLVNTGKQVKNSAPIEKAQITINITKKLPTTVPALTVKEKQSINPLKVYVKPNSYGATDPTAWTTPWDITNEGVVYGEDIKKYNFEDIFEGLTTRTDGADVKKFEFEIANSDRFNNGTPNKPDWKVRSTVATHGTQYVLAEEWYKNHENKATSLTSLIPDAYSVPYVNFAKIGDEKHGVTVYYPYEELSVYKDQNGNPKWDDVTYRSKDMSNEFTVQYICALDLDRIHLLTKKEVDTRKKAVDSKLGSSDKEWSGKGEDDAQKLIEKAWTIEYKVDGTGKVEPKADITLGNVYFTFATPAVDGKKVLDELAWKASTYSTESGIDVEGIDPDKYLSREYDAKYASGNGNADLMQAELEKFFKSGNVKITNVTLSNTQYINLDASVYTKNADNTINYKDILDSGKVKFIRLSEVDARTEDLPLKLNITFADVIGHTKTVTIPVLLKKPANLARGL